MKKIELVDHSTLIDNYDDFVDGKMKAVISLPVPVMDVRMWFKKRDAYASILGMTGTELEKVVYYVSYAVTDPGETEMTVGTVLSEADLKAAREKYGDAFSADIGAAAVKKLFSRIDLEAVYNELRSQEKECMASLERIRNDSENEEFDEKECEEPKEGLSEEDILCQSLGDVREKLDCMFFIKECREKLFITEIRLFPLELRPMAKGSVPRTPYGILNDLENLYLRVFNRADRIRRLTELKAPEVIILNESRLLQEMVDCLLANGMRGKPATKGNGRPLFCIRDLLETYVTTV